MACVYSVYIGGRFELPQPSWGELFRMWNTSKKGFILLTVCLASMLASVPAVLATGDILPPPIISDMSVGRAGHSLGYGDILPPPIISD